MAKMRRIGAVVAGEAEQIPVRVLDQLTSARSPSTVPDADTVHYYTDGKHLIGVEVALDSSRLPVAVGLSVRRLTPVEAPRTDVAGRLDQQMRRMTLKRPLFVGEPRPISSRDVRRLRLDAITRAAAAFDEKFYERRGTGHHEPDALAAEEKTRRVLAPRRRRPDDRYYRQLLDAYQGLVKRGERAPAKALAKRMGLEHNVNLIHQQVWRARQLDKQGRLPPASGRSGGKR